MPQTLSHPTATPGNPGTKPVTPRTAARTGFLGGISLLFRGSRGLTKAALNLEPVDDERLRERRRQCAGCGQATHTKATHIQSLRILSPSSSCDLCKCVIHAKTKVAGETCPLGKW